MLETFERFAEQEFVSATDLDPFVRSHPVARRSPQRSCAEKVAASPYANDKDPRQLQLRHDMMRAKISTATLDRPQTVYNRYPAKRQQPAGALRARASPAIARAGASQAIAEIDALIQRKAGQPLFLGAEGRAATAKAGQRAGDRASAQPSAS